MTAIAQDLTSFDSEIRTAGATLRSLSDGERPEVTPGDALAMLNEIPPSLRTSDIVDAISILEKCIQAKQTSIHLLALVSNF